MYPKFVEPTPTFSNSAKFVASSNTIDPVEVEEYSAANWVLGTSVSTPSIVTVFWDEYIPWFFWLTFIWSPSLVTAGLPDKNTFPPAAPLRSVAAAPAVYWIVFPIPVANSPWTLSRINSLTPVIEAIENWIPDPREVNPTVETPTTSPTE